MQYPRFQKEKTLTCTYKFIGILRSRKWGCESGALTRKPTLAERMVGTSLRLPMLRSTAMTAGMGRGCERVPEIHATFIAKWGAEGAEPEQRIPPAAVGWCAGSTP